MSSEQAQATGRESDTTSTQEPAPQSADTFAARPETDESRRETGSSSGADAEPESTEFGPTEDEIRYRAYLFYIERGSGNLIAGCTFRNLGSVAVCMGQGIKTDPDGLIGYTLQQGAERGEVVKLEPVSRQLGDYTMALYGDTTWDRKAGTHHGVVGCDITNTGAGGIILGGGDRKTLTPAGNYVLNCHISRFNRLERNGRAAVNIAGVGNRVVHCLIHDAPSRPIPTIGAATSCTRTCPSGRGVSAQAPMMMPGTTWSPTKTPALWTRRP